MRALLDTHTFIWYAIDDPALSVTARRVIADLTIEKLVSAATIWEISIKLALRKLTLDMNFDQLIGEGIEGSGFTLLPILPRHASRLVTLPHLHRDPFDRMIVAQGLVDECTIVGCDVEMDRYGVTRVW